MGEEQTSAGVEIVGMLIVAEQDGVDRRQILRAAGWPSGLAQDNRPASIFAAGRIEVGSVSKRRPPISSNAVGRRST